MAAQKKADSPVDGGCSADGQFSGGICAGGGRRGAGGERGGRSRQRGGCQRDDSVL